MKWSVSTTKLFQTCPRKYYYQQILADKNSDDPRAKEAYALKRLQNLYAWRGSLVDGVISRFIVPSINHREQIKADEIIAYARDLTRKELDCVRESIVNGSIGQSNGNGNLGFFELEYGHDVNLDLINTLENDVVKSLQNLFNSSLFSEIKDSQSYLIAQRTLKFPFNNLTISCTPDLIVFSKNDPPKVVDWKVESIFREHWLQLGIYGFALSKVSPHKDFPSKWHDFIKNPKNIDLVEFQLLRNREQKYKINDDDLVDIEDYIHVTSSQITKLIGNSQPVDINQFPTAKSPETCLKCQYRKMCWRELGYDPI